MTESSVRADNRVRGLLMYSRKETPCAYIRNGGVTVSTPLFHGCLMYK